MYPAFQTTEKTHFIIIQPLPSRGWLVGCVGVRVGGASSGGYRGNKRPYCKAAAAYS